MKKSGLENLRRDANSFLFSWDMNGIERIICLNEYRDWDESNTFKILKGEPTAENPINWILNTVLLRAKFNSHRHYEIYTITADLELDTDFWKNQWEKYPQETANIVREKGNKIHSDRMPNTVKIT
jgi:hypothetical protein